MECNNLFLFFFPLKSVCGRAMILIQRGKIKKIRLEAKLIGKKKKNINKNGWCGKLGVEAKCGKL